MPRKREEVERTRTTISLPTVVFGWAIEMMRLRGFSSLNELLADLIREDYERRYGPTRINPIDPRAHLLNERAQPAAQPDTKRLASGL